MSYRFTDIDNIPFSVRDGIEVSIDGINLDRSIPGYKTLTVSGREIIGRDIETRNYKTMRAGSKTSTIKNRRGKLASNELLSSSLTVRTIVVEYFLRQDKTRDFITSFEKFNYYINKEEVMLRFSDDPDFYFVGTLTQVGDVDAGANWVKSTFQYDCMDCFKYSLELHEWRFTTTGKFLQMGYFPVRIEKIKMIVKNATNRLNIQNNNSKSYIRIDGNFKANDEIVIDFLEGDIVLNGGNSLMPQLYIFSDFEDFGVDYEETIVTNVACDVSLFYRRRLL